MSDNVQMPALGESVTEGTVTRWLKQVGEVVELDEPLLEVSTDKVDTEIPAPFAGVLEQIVVQEDETVEVGAVLAVIGSGIAAPAAPAAAHFAAPAPVAVPVPVAVPEPGTAGVSAAGAGEEIRLPALGESVTEGTVTRWLKQVGEPIEIDEPLLEVSTDKVDTEVPSPVAGIVQQILVPEDETVEVGTVLAIIGSGVAPVAAPVAPPAPVASPVPVAAHAMAPAPVPSSAPVAAPVTQAPQVHAAPPAVADASTTARAVTGSYLTPLVRKLAAEQHVDISTVVGTGVGGRIRREDVLAAVKPAPVAQTAVQAPRASTTPEISPLRGTTEKASRLRKIIAERMVDALHSQAQLTTVVEVDVTRVASLRAKAKDAFKAREGVNLTFLPFFALAAVEALKTYPKVNGVLEGDTITYHAQENVGIAVDTPRGLLVPVLRNAGDLDLAGISRGIADLATRTRDNKVSPDDLSGGTFTITNTGSGGALIDTPIVPGGTSAILGTGTIVKRPAVIKDADGNEAIAIRSMCYLFLSYDHRLVDGADAARFLSAVKKRIEDGAFEAEVGL